MNTKRITAVTLTAFVLGGCGASSTLQDLEGIHAKEPEIIQAYYNVNLHPNVVVSCPNGPDSFGYATTTRDYDSVPMFWEKCPIQEEEGEQIELQTGVE